MCCQWAGSNPSVPLSWVLVGLWVPEPGLPWAEPRDCPGMTLHSSNKLSGALRNETFPPPSSCLIKLFLSEWNEDCPNPLARGGGGLGVGGDSPQRPPVTRRQANRFSEPP